jgi:putative two-component system response regulator
MSDEGSRKTILAVDDAPENLDVVKSILVPDYTVMAAINGKMALKIAEARMPDLSLLDVMMATRSANGSSPMRRPAPFRSFS